jgi:hypothetical protein
MMELGDLLEKAFERLGITQEKVEMILGSCRCRERQDQLNALSAWARRVLSGRTAGAMDFFKRMTS